MTFTFETADTGSRILQAAHAVDHRQPEAFHFRLAVGRVLRPRSFVRFGRECRSDHSDAHDRHYQQR